jgi:tRNA(fMet)-specific endonuclease VapC
VGAGTGGHPIDAAYRGAGLERLILDTTILVTAERGQRRLENAIADDDDVAVAAVTVAELLVGIELAGARHRARRESFVDEVLATLRIEDYTLSTARAHSRLLADVRRSGRPRSAHDLIIAATAISAERIVLTADALGFEDLAGVQVRVLER